MKNISLNRFIDSIKDFDNLNQIVQIQWLVFYKLFIEKVEYVKKDQIKSLFSQCWVGEPKNFDQLWFYLTKKQILIKQKDGFVLNRTIYKSFRESYLSPSPVPKIEKKLKKISNGKIVPIPPTVLKLFPKDLIKHCDQLNDNLGAENWIASMLLMRKILPLAIIRKFQRDNKEAKIKSPKGEYFGSEKLLEKSQNLIPPRIYREIKEIKFLYDGIQHFFGFSPDEPDISPAMIRLRVFLEELFKKKTI